MMKKVTIFMLSLAMTAAMLSGCSSSNDSSSSSTAETTTAAETTVADETTETEAAEETSQEETVDEEENYDTGDASLDNIRNQDEIGEQELLVLSFGTSYNDSRRLTVGAIENDLESAFPDFSVRRGFTSNKIVCITILGQQILHLLINFIGICFCTVTHKANGSLSIIIIGCPFGNCLFYLCKVVITAQQRFAKYNLIECIRIVTNFFYQFIIFQTMHQMCRLYNQVLYAIIYSTIHGSIYVINQNIVPPSDCWCN